MVTEIDVCPVCDMLGEFSVYTMKHNKKTLHFCSEQCKEMFAAHPRLYFGKTEQSKDIKRRTLRMAEPLDAETTKQVISHLTAMMGIKEVAVDGDKVHITYDLLQVTEEMIERALAEADLPIGGGWLERWRRAWTQGSEETELDNISARPAPGCHKPPPKI